MKVRLYIDNTNQYYIIPSNHISLYVTNLLNFVVMTLRTIKWLLTVFRTIDTNVNKINYL